MVKKLLMVVVIVLTIFNLNAITEVNIKERPKTIKANPTIDPEFHGKWILNNISSDKGKTIRNTPAIMGYCSAKEFQWDDTTIWTVKYVTVKQTDGVKYNIIWWHGINQMWIVSAINSNLLSFEVWNTVTKKEMIRALVFLE